MATKSGQRIAIWVITIVMAVGTLGAYFIVILENNNAQREQEAFKKQLEEANKPDPTAYTVKDKVTELKIEDLKVGEGAEVKAGDTVTAHYKGTIAQTGVKFDSSYDRGEPATFSLDQVIKGWQEGVPGMKVGGKRRLIIPADKAYGSQANEKIPANSDLVFEIELIKINPKQ